jgi:hypothetical protein
MGNYTQTGGTTTVYGTLATSAPGGINILGGSGFGTGTFAGNLTSSGTINIGDALKKASTLADTGSYTQNSSGALNVDIGGLTAGTQFDQLNVTGAASLSGTLNLDLINGFTPTLGSTFDITNFASLTGMFGTVNGVAINGSEHFSVVYSATNVTLDVVAGAAPLRSPAATPEPASIILLGSGLVGVLARRLNRRQARLSV